MSYIFETQHNSPNFTRGSQVPATWGRPFEHKAIAIHWWGDPNKNPSYEGTINTLCNPNSGVSAHFVATGTGRRVAQLIDFDNASWATNSANPYTISIECDPRCRDEDYDVVAELISQIRDAFGPLPLVPHRQFAATACPGNYDLGRLDALANTKDGSGDWGTVVNKQEPLPEPDPNDGLYKLIVNGKQVAAYKVEKNAYDGWVNYGSTGTIMQNGQDVTKQVVDKYAPVPNPEPEPKPEPEPEPEPTPEPSEPTTLWDDIVKWFKDTVVAFFKKYVRK